MTAKNAIYHLSREHICNEVARQTAIKALKKQIPKKPIGKQIIGASITGYKYKSGQCPECLSTVCHNYCPNCGQALDWSENE